MLSYYHSACVLDCLDCIRGAWQQMEKNHLGPASEQAFPGTDYFSRSFQFPFSAWPEAGCVWGVVSVFLLILAFSTA